MSAATLERSINTAPQTNRDGQNSGASKPLHEFTDPFYRTLYNHNQEKSDSPDRSRRTLVREARRHISALTKQDYVLDLGSGPQIFERLFFQSNQSSEKPRALRRRADKPKPTFITVDRADIEPHNLLMRSSHRVQHIQASGEALPLPDEMFGVVVSNMALDFMGDKAITEMHRVMKTGAHALVRLHHPSLFPENPQELLASSRIPNNEKAPIAFWEVLRERGALTADQAEVYRRFATAGFDIQDLRLGEDHKDFWWELDLVKSPTDKLKERATKV